MEQEDQNCDVIAILKDKKLDTHLTLEIFQIIWYILH